MHIHIITIQQKTEDKMTGGFGWFIFEIVIDGDHYMIIVVIGVDGIRAASINDKVLVNSIYIL